LLFRALIDENFENAFSVILSANSGLSLQEQVASFISVLEDYTLEEQDKEELLTALKRQVEPSAAAGGSSSAAGGASAAPTSSKSPAPSAAASSSSFVPASPARPQQQVDNPVAGRTYFKVCNMML
jgi:hypothetical protein